MKIWKVKPKAEHFQNSLFRKCEVTYLPQIFPKTSTHYTTTRFMVLIFKMLIAMVISQVEQAIWFSKGTKHRRFEKLTNL